MLDELAQHEDPDIRFRVARNVKTSENTLRALAQDFRAKPREGVARNENAPAAVLVVLLKDKSVLVRRAAEANPRTPREPLKALGRVRIDHTDSGAKTRGAGPSAAPTLAMAIPSAGPAQAERSRILDESWLFDFIALARGGVAWGGSRRIPLPQASREATYEQARSLDFPAWLKVGLPDAITADLMREHRPPWLRRLTAGGLTIADTATRDRLLSDSDPEIRWRALQRTVEAPDDQLRDLLGRLGRDKNERIRFRTEGDNRTRGERDRTPAQYDIETLCVIASHPSTPLTVLRELTSAKSSDVIINLIENPALPTVDLERILPRLQSTRSAHLRERLAASSKMPDAAAQALAADRDVAVRGLVARNALTPIVTLSRLADDPDTFVRFNLLQNIALTGDLFAAVAVPLLAANADATLLEALNAVGERGAKHLNAEVLQGALDRLAKSRVRDPDMRLLVAGDDRAGARTLERLARSSDESVRRAVAGNIRTPAATLRELSIDFDAGVRSGAASNETIELGSLVALANDDDPEVRTGAAKNIRLAPKHLRVLLRDDARSVRRAAILNPATRAEDKAEVQAEWDKVWRESGPSRADLEQMVASKRAEVRTQVAADSRTPPDILRFLGGERASVKVRRTVAANPTTPAETLQSLARDQDIQVRQAVAFNSATSAEVLSDLANSAVDLALLVALNPDAPSPTLDALIDSHEALVRFVAEGARAQRGAIDHFQSARELPADDPTT